MASKIERKNHSPIKDDEKINFKKIKQRMPTTSKSDMQIILCLGKSGILKPQDIALKTRISLRSVRYSLKKLVDLNMVIRVPDLEDLRSYYYKVAKI